MKYVDLRKIMYLSPIPWGLEWELGVKYQKELFARNCMKCADLHWKIMSLSPNLLGVGSNTNKCLLWVAWKVMFQTISPHESFKKYICWQLKEIFRCAQKNMYQTSIPCGWWCLLLGFKWNVQICTKKVYKKTFHDTTGGFRRLSKVPGVFTGPFTEGGS